MKRVLVTGATGLVGRVLCDVLAHNGYAVRAAVRSAGDQLAAAVDAVYVGDIAARADWKDALAGVDYVCHLAARAHILDPSASRECDYLSTNVSATRSLLASCVAAGVHRIVYVSSIKVNGELTLGEAFTAGDVPAPQDDYARSKCLAEQAVREASAAGKLESVIVRPPLVYGPGVRANFLRLMEWVDRERPLPLGAVANARSLVSVWNLASMLVRTLEHPAAAGRVWLVSDGTDLSTPDLVRGLGRALGRRVRLVSVPVSVLRLAGRLAGRAAEVARLCGSLEIDISATRRELDWSPVLSVADGLARTAQWYRGRRP